MRRTFKSAVSSATVLGLILLTAQTGAVAAPGARLEGLLVGADGRPAAGHQVRLIDGEGTDVGSATTTDDGLYSFGGLPAGDYGLVVEGPEGGMGALAGPPLELGDNELARRDLKLLDAGSVDPGLSANYGLRARYAGMTGGEKAWFWVVVAVVGGLTLFLIFEDDDEDPASDFVVPQG